MLSFFTPLRFPTIVWVWMSNIVPRWQACMLLVLCYGVALSASGQGNSYITPANGNWAASAGQTPTYTHGEYKAGSYQSYSWIVSSNGVITARTSTSVTVQWSAPGTGQIQYQVPVKWSSGNGQCEVLPSPAHDRKGTSWRPARHLQKIHARVQGRVRPTGDHRRAANRRSPCPGYPARAAGSLATPGVRAGSAQQCGARGNLALARQVEARGSRAG